MANMRVPNLSEKGTAFVQSIIGAGMDTLNPDLLSQRQIEELLTLLETEWETASDPDDFHAIGELAATLTRRRHG